MAILKLVRVTYNDFKLNTTIEPDQFDQNNVDIVTKVDEIVDYVNSLDDVTDSVSGADKVGATTITDLTGNTVQSIMEDFVSKIRSITDSASGADFVCATAVSGLTGTTVQALIESLKSYIDTHKVSIDHDGRYYTKTQLDAGQFDTRYYTKTLADGKFALITDLQAIALGNVPDGTWTTAKMAIEQKRAVANGVAPLNVNATIDKAYVPNAVLADTATIANDTVAVNRNTPTTTLDKEFAKNEGFYFDKDYYYQRNTKLIAGFQSDETWTSVAGTQSADTTNIKIGLQSIKILENDNVAGALYSDRTVSLDLTKFNDGSASSTSDYIYLVYYVSDATKVDTSGTNGIWINFGTTVWANNYAYRISSFVTGWNYTKIKKSDFTSSGAPNWNNIIALRMIWHSVVTAQNAYISFNYLSMIRKDPISAIPNPFQREIDGVWTKDIYIASGEWVLYKDTNGKVVCVEIVGTILTGVSTTSASLLQLNPFQNCVISTSIKCTVTNYTYSCIWEYNNLNRVRSFVYDGILYLSTTIAGTDTNVSSVALPLAIGDIISFTLVKQGQSFSVTVIKNNSSSYVLSTTVASFATYSGYLGIGVCNVGVTQIESMSITTTQHAYHADVAEVSKSINGGWDKISEVTLSVDTAQLNINIPNGYRFIRVVGYNLYSDTTFDDLALRFNNDSTSLHYAYRSFGVNSQSAQYDHIKLGYAMLQPASGTYHSTFDITINNIPNLTKLMSGIVNMGWDGNGNIQVTKGLWYTSNALITQLNFFIPSTNKIKTGGQFILWGMR